MFIGGLVVGSFLFNSGFRETIQRRKAIRDAQAELNSVQVQMAKLKEEIKFIKKNPRGYEELVRKELGYLKPGEKEIRFVNE